MAESGSRIARGGPLALVGLAIAAIGLPSRTSFATRKSKKPDHAERARKTEAAAWSTAHDLKAACRAALVRSCTRISPRSWQDAMRRAKPSTSRR